MAGSAKHVPPKDLGLLMRLRFLLPGLEDYEVCVNPVLWAKQLGVNKVLNRLVLPVVAIVIAITSGDAAACGRRRVVVCGPCLCAYLAPYPCQPSSSGALPGGSPSASPGDSTQGSISGDESLTEADSAKIKASLKDLKISDGDADQFVKSMKEAKNQLGAAIILETLQGEDIKKLDEAGKRGILKTLVDAASK